MSDQLARDLAAVLNRHSAENQSGTPDWILADYLIGCLDAWNAATRQRDQWWDTEHKIGGTIPAVDE